MKKFLIVFLILVVSTISACQKTMEADVIAFGTVLDFRTMEPSTEKYAFKVEITDGDMQYFIFDITEKVNFATEEDKDMVIDFDKEVLVEYDTETGTTYLFQEVEQKVTVKLYFDKENEKWECMLEEIE